MINGFEFKALTVKGESELWRNAKIPLMAKPLLKRVVVSKDPLIIRFLFKKTFHAYISRFNLDPFEFDEKLCDEMECVRGYDYEFKLLGV
jgi:hypothetical protein